MGLIQTAKAPFVSLSLSVLRREHFPPEIASPIMMLQHTWRLFSKTWIPTPGNVPAHHCGSIGGGAFPKWITIVSSAQHNLAFYHTDRPCGSMRPPTPVKILKDKVVLENIDIEIDKEVWDISISISIRWFWKISISIRRFWKIYILNDLGVAHLWKKELLSLRCCIIMEKIEGVAHLW